MDRFCNGKPLWDSNLTWDGDWPEFTECFQDTILVWITSGWLWTTAPFYVIYLAQLSSTRCQWTWKTYTKLVLTVLLLALQSMDVVFAVSKLTNDWMKASVFAPIIEGITLILIMIYIAMERQKGLVTSGILFIYWTLSLLSSIIPFYSKIIKKEYETKLFEFVIFYLSFTFTVIQWILNSIAENHLQQKDMNPEQESSFLSRITFSWMTRLMMQGYKKPLTEDSVFGLKQRDTSQEAYSRFYNNWVTECASASHEYETANHQYHLQEAESETSYLLLKSLKNIKSQQHQTKPSLIKVLCRTFAVQLFIANIWKIVYDVTLFISPFLLKMLIDYTAASKDPEISNFTQEWKGYSLVAAFFVTILIQSLMFHQQSFWSMTLGMRVRSALMSAVYQKALRMTSEARQNSTVGEIVNLMSIDAQNIQDFISYFWVLWSSPLQSCFSLYFLYDTMGHSMWSGIGVLLILIPLNGFVISKIHKLQAQQMRQKDERIKLLSEVLNGIKILKLYAWEMAFKDKVLIIRNMELKILFKAAIYRIVIIFSRAVAPYFVSLATFATYIFMSSDHYLDAKKAFVAISLFNILRVAISFAPMAVNKTIKASVSFHRLNRYLNSKDLNQTNVVHNTPKDDAIVIEDGTFSWDPDGGKCFRNINITIPEKKLVAVVGHVGCGKSSLLSSILGDMTKVKGSVRVKGKISYVPQQAWIQNASVVDNILFGCGMDQKKYKDVIDACALRTELDILPASDRTELGEKGINLSGGQKQRISLARAVYHDTDIYLLDDPLSSVDSNVGKHIFEKVIGNTGLLSDKTRVLVTHGLRWLPFVDKIIVMVDGSISEIGTYEELLSHDGAFAQFLKMYIIETAEDEDDPEEEKIKTDISQRLISGGSGDNYDRLLETQTDDVKLLMKICESKRLRNGSKLSQESFVEVPIQKSKLTTDETTEEGHVRLSIFITYAKAIGLVIVGIILFVYALYQISSVLANIWLSQWTSDSVLTNRTLGKPDSHTYMAKNNYYLLVYGGFGIAQAVFVLVFIGIFMVRSITATKLLHERLLHSVIRSPMSFFDTTPIGRIVNRFSADTDTIDNDLPTTVQKWLECVFRVISTLVVISYSTPLFCAVIVPFGVAYFFLQRFYVATSRQLKRLQSKTRSPIYSHFSETISGATVIRAYCAEKSFIKTSNDRINLNQRFQYAIISANRWLGIRLEFFGNIIICSAALLAVLSRGSIEGAIVGLSISYALQMTDNLNWFVRMTSDLETNIVSVERVKEYTDIPAEAELYNDYKLPVNTNQQGVIEFQQYSTRYRDGLSLVLKNITFKIEPGEKVGIVGRTGAGKTSLSQAIFRLIEPTTGRIIVDGEDISMMGLHDCRSKVTVLPQDPVLFSGSLRMNIDPMEHHTDDQIWRALEHAHIKDFIQHLPSKLDYDCGEGGQNLSIGQRQLISLARSILRKSKILILDEATAAVDMEKDALIQQTIREEFSECTVLTIAHRLNTVMDYNRIMVLDNGKIIQFDTPENLLRHPGGLFYQLAKDSGII
ncbi:multidrug resistance-associated protein 1-like [Mytilus galloprovincialis]|uniref:multidrug resistance-associated protein 1-like n=1 Tax=Mytilus galloprovincialis TaxID=29158 RepID=UPI003F7C130D